MSDTKVVAYLAERFLGAPLAGALDRAGTRPAPTREYHVHQADPV